MPTDINLSLFIDIATIILSVAAIILTAIGFFASLNFYREGVRLQSSASGLLARIDEKVASVQSQVGGLFDRTLDAIIGGSSEQAAKEQRRLLLPAEETHEPDESVASATGSTTLDDLETAVMDYFSFKKIRYTDVTSGDAHAIFMLGSAQNFNLFDSPTDVVFLGYFHDLQVRQIVARVRFLFNNIDSSYKKIESADPNQKEAAKRILDMIKVVLIVGESEDSERLTVAIDRYRPTARIVTVEIHKPSQITAAVEAEYQQMAI